MTEPAVRMTPGQRVAITAAIARLRESLGPNDRDPLRPHRVAQIDLLEQMLARASLITTTEIPSWP